MIMDMKAMDAAVATVAHSDSIATLLLLASEIAGSKVALLARVTDEVWTVCAAREVSAAGVSVDYRLPLGLPVRVGLSAMGVPIYITHSGQQSFAALPSSPIACGFAAPVVLANGRYFGVLCALDRISPDRVDGRIESKFKRLSSVVASQIDQLELRDREKTGLLVERSAGQLREQFISILGRDLRNPLQAIFASSDLLARQLLYPAHAQLAARIKTNARRMAALIDDVLDYARGRLGGEIGVELSEVENINTGLMPVGPERSDARADWEIVPDGGQSALHDLLSANRALLIDRCRGMVASRSQPKLPLPERVHGIPVFLDQIIKTLRIEQRSDYVPQPIASDAPDDGLDPDVVPMAALHGRDLLQEGFTVEQVIRDYGDVCQAVTNLAVEAGVSISASEFHTFNRCLDDAIAAAVTEYSQQNSQIALTRTETALCAAQIDVRDAQLRAMHDSLTGLPNRKLFDNRLAQAIALADRHHWTLAVMFLDLDQFKHVNDAHGHTAGDAALKSVAHRLLRCAREEDTVCRNGGDEFLYLIMHPRGKKNIEQIANSVMRTVARPLVVAAARLAIKPSIGIAIYPEDGASGGELIKKADAAMYVAKRYARGIAFFDSREARGVTA
jgi:diguanylate cyclase (GGDEF)-like protein